MEPVPPEPAEATEPSQETERQRIRAETLLARIAGADGPHRPSDDFEGCTE